MENRNSITNETGDTYDSVSSTYSNIIKTNNKTRIIKKKKKESQTEQFLLYMFDWKIVFITLLISVLLITLGCAKLYTHLKLTNRYSEYGLSMISYFQYGIIINLFIIVFSISFFFNIKTNTGQKGMTGDIGKKGPQGENVYCDICNSKPVSIKKIHNYDLTTHIEEPSNLQKLKEIQTGWDILEIGTNNQLNSYQTDCENLQNCSKTQLKNDNILYLMGVIVSLDDTNNITTLQFIAKDKSYSKKFIPKQKKWGNQTLKNIKTLEAPKNCGIYKITSFIKNNKLVGLKLFYKHTNKNKKLDKNMETIGNTKGQNITVEVSKDQNSNKPFFLSDVNCIYDENNIYNLIFNKKSINHDYDLL